MKKLVKVWFPVMRYWSEDIVVTIPEGVDQDDWLAAERYRLIRENAEFDPTFVDEDRLSDLCWLSIAGAKFVEPGPGWRSSVISLPIELTTPDEKEN